jgi:hypothetical protein
MSAIVCNFSDVYKNQPFMEGLRWLDFTNLASTDCYCDDEAVTAIRKQIAEAGIENAQGIHFIDSGNYHYMSKIWTDMVQEPFTLVVFDHHPDMQEPRFGDILSCGGWVKKTLDENKFIDNVVLIGVADHLVEEIPPHDKVTFIRESELPSVTLDSILSLRSRTALRLQNDNRKRVHSTLHIPHSAPLYISIDKDALSPAYAATNWDQGTLSLKQMKAFIEELSKNRRIIGVDICGERARDFSGNEHYSVQEADTLNDRTNRELLDFITQQIARHAISP